MIPRELPKPDFSKCVPNVDPSPNPPPPPEKPGVSYPVKNRPAKNKENPFKDRIT